MRQIRNRFWMTGVLFSSAVVVDVAWAAESTGSTQPATTATQAPAVTNGIPAAGDVPVVEKLQQALPGASVKMRNGRLTRVQGPALATGHTPDASAEAFSAKALGAFGTKRNALRPISLAQGHRTVVAKPEPSGLMYDQKTGQYKFSLYRYGQHVGGIPVHDAELLVLVKNGANNPVVSATSTLRNIARFASPSAPRTLVVDATKSLNAARAHAAKKAEKNLAPLSLDSVDQPELVIFAGDSEDNAPPRLAMRYSAGDSRAPARWRFVADAYSGDILHTQNPMRSADVSGTVHANVTVNPIAADCAAEQSVPLAYAEVGITGGATSFTSATGTFSLSAGTTPVEAYSTLHGHWIDVFSYPGYDEELTRTVTPPASVQFLQNAADDQEFVIAQANAYYHVNLARDFLLHYIPDYPYISTTEHYKVTVNGDETTPGWHGMPGMCPGNAWQFDWHEILFCKQGDGVRNTAFGTIAYHEFGHEIVLDGGSEQGQYGEGIADSVAMLMTGDPRIGIGYKDTDCTNVRRDPRDPVCQYDAVNCTTNCGDASDTHGCGRLLSGIVWDLREALRATHPGDFQDIVSALVLNSVKMHTGMLIDGQIELDMLELDDDDGNIDNGTPHAAEICGAFARHGIPCPISQSGPCDGICTNPVTFTWSNNYQSGALGTLPICRETTQAIAGGNCGNFAGGRTIAVNGNVMACNGQNWSSIPARRNGGYCVTTTAGNYPWAYYTMW